ncbi:MAG: hypothetical protein A2X48_17080 [Lentisphaerae bacterium GWF2_49_21]|nr:MAG: hypothetical protein A2X48_17080 [Lentisphaerae bacterium GWF2_49_21]
MKHRGYLGLVRSHLDRQLKYGLADFGPSPSPMWMSSLDTRTGKYPENDSRPVHIPRRHYRAIDAPKGCSLYWDQPSCVAAHALSKITGEKSYGAAVDSYVSAFLERCIAKNGIFLWGNHYYWDAFQGKTLKFKGEEVPKSVDFEIENGDYHEARPIPPAWDLFWKVSPEKTEKEIRAYCLNSFFDLKTGGFNRHSDRKKGCAFIESGGIIAESLAWLYGKTNDKSLLDQANLIINYSFTEKGLETGLLVNNPTVTRWDKFASTTECGLWGGSLLRASACAGRKTEWIEKASSAVSAYLKYGYDESSDKYWGRLRVADGSPIIGKSESDKPNDISEKHQPLDYADIWRPLFPAHDYPMQFAECCLCIYEITGEEIYREACDRWVRQIKESLSDRNHGKYAEHYGRCIHFLLRFGKDSKNSEYLKLAQTLADEAVETLFDNGMFRGHPGEHRYDAVDGVGFLMLALLCLETDNEIDMMGMGW